MDSDPFPPTLIPQPPSPRQLSPAELEARRLGGIRRAEKQREANSEVGQFFRRFLTSVSYRKNAIRRVLAGEADHLETLWYGYAWGKPKEQVDVNVKSLSVVIGVPASELGGLPTIDLTPIESSTSSQPSE